MELQGYEPYVANQPREIKTADKLVRISKDGKETVINILLTRDNRIICRAAEGDAPKFELYVTTWTQEDGMPMINGGLMWKLYVPVGSKAPEGAPVEAKRERPAKGESKLDKCRAIFKANAGLDKAAMKKLFVEQGGCTEGGANTYYLTISKE